MHLDEQYSHYLQLKQAMHANMMEAQMERMDSHLAYVEEEMRFWKQKLDRIRGRISNQTLYKSTV